MNPKSNYTDWQTRIRLWAAIIMAVYAIGYNIYYALGLISLETIEDYGKFIYNLWPLFFVIPFVILTHVSLGLWKLFKRNTFKMPLWEKAQIILGICIPFFLLPHFIFTYGYFFFFGVNENYYDILSNTYPIFIWQYIAMTVIVWAHAQIGVHVVLRMRRWYPKIKYLIIIIFVLMPVIGIAGYLRSGLELNEYSSNQEYQTQKPPVNELNTLKALSYSIYIIFPLLYAVVLTARGIRIIKRNKERNIIVDYTGNKSIKVFPKTTVLEASRIAEIPHASICGGRGRCTTCRIKVESGMDNLSPVGTRELAALKRISAGEGIRLACQAECRKDNISVTLLLPPDIKSIRARKETKFTVGSELELAVMFVDLRGFTSLSEDKFPYDVVFILNNYFNSMGEIIEKNGGTIDKFIGDGIMAYFGFKTNPEVSCRQALLSAKQMAQKLENINKELKSVINEPLEIGIGLHFGEVILGELGYKENKSLTIIGDTVNTASRLESLNKKTGSELIFSTIVAEKAGFDFPELKKFNVAIRGKKDQINIYTVKDIANDLKLND